MFTADLGTVQHQISDEQCFLKQKYGVVIEQDPATWETEDSSPYCLERIFPQKTPHISEQKNEKSVLTTPFSEFGFKINIKASHSNFQFFCYFLIRV